MSVHVEQIIDDILRREGNTYTDDPADRGGPTKYGITQRTLSAYLGRPATEEDVQNLTEGVARQAYFQIFVRDPGFAKVIDGELMALLVDCGVHSGPGTAVTWLQRALGVKEDGHLGPATADAANRSHPRQLFAKVLASRFKHYAAIVSRDPGQAKWIKGWTNRACEFLENCT